MFDPFVEKKAQYKREVYMLANRNPWLLWKLQILKSGQLPPLVNGRIPPELASFPFNRSKEFDSQVLVEHAEQVKAREKKYVWKTFTAIMLAFFLFLGLSYLLAHKYKDEFRIGIVDTFFERARSPEPQTIHRGT